MTSSKQISLKRKINQFPIFIAGLTENTAELAGEVADGLMPYLASTDHLKRLSDSAKKGREKSELKSEIYQDLIRDYHKAKTDKDDELRRKIGAILNNTYLKKITFN